VSGRRRLLMLFLVSLLLRLGAVGVMALVDARPAFDEHHYVQRAEGWASLIGLSDRTPQETAFDRAFDDGFQPPLHPLLMGMVTGGGRLPLSGRVWNALLGALATPLIFVFARRFVGDRESTAAAWIHAGFPTSLFFAASLWAEPLYIVLMLLTVIFATGTRPRFILAGVCLGALLLTRSAALPYLLLVPWLVIRNPAVRWRSALVVVGLAFVVVMPWQLILHHETGHWPLLSTSGGWNLALGNASDIGPGEGSLWVGPEAHERLKQDIMQAGGGGAYAVHQIRENPTLAIRRALDRLRLTWAADLFPTRHAAHAIHKPLPTWAGAARWTSQVLVWLGVLSLVVQGLLRSQFVHDRRVLLLLVLAGCLGPLLTVGFPRLHHPLLIVLLPAAGVGWVRRHDILSMNRQLVAAAVMGVMAWITTSSLPAIIETQMLPSASSQAWVGPVARLSGAEPVYADQVLVRTRGEIRDAVWIEPSPGHRVELEPGTWQQLVTVHAGRPHETRMLVLGVAGGTNVIVDAVDRDWWRQWRPLGEYGLPELEVMWLGGGVAD
jgi:hypothetical protein